MRIALIDLETTGLDPDKHEIIEIGCVLFDDRTFEILCELDIRVIPEHIETADPKALQVNGYRPEDWKDAVPLYKALGLLRAITSEETKFCAHNMIFDWGFLAAAMKKTGLEMPFERHRIDLFTLAWAHIPHEKMRSWSLKTICAYLQLVPEPKVHRAINGARTAYTVYKRLMT